MNGSWAASMRASLLAALARPAWWAIALAAFLVRGGIVVAILPIVSLPSTASLTNLLAPTVEDLILGGAGAGSVAAGTVLVSGALVALYGLAWAGSWLELALVRETTTDADIEVTWSPASRPANLALGARLVAHLPTAIALGYGAVRIVDVLYLELTSPGDTAVPLAVRILAQAPDVPLAVTITWLLGEAVGGLTARRIAAGEAVGPALARSIRQVATPSGIATLAVTSAALAALLVPYLVTVAAAWQNVRVALLDGAGETVALAALALMVSTWILGLALLGALLAWRATAWTVQVAPRAATVTQPMLQASEPSRGG